MAPDRLTLRLRAHRTPILMAFDGAALVTSYALISVLRYDDAVLTPRAFDVASVAMAAVALQWAIGLAGSFYRGRVGVASVEETVALGLAALGGGTAVAVVNALAEPHFVARSVPIGATSLAIVLMLLGRGWWRLTQRPARAVGSDDAKRTLVLGAGEAGRQLVASMLNSERSPYLPVALLDDDPWKRRRRLENVPVMGTRVDMARVTEQTAAETLVIAIPSAGPDLIREMSQHAGGCGLEIKVIPALHELLGDNVGVRDVRDIDLRDLLGRKPVDIDVSAIAGYLSGRRVLVTGAGGSIGSQLCHEIGRWRPDQLIMLDRDESALHALELALKGRAMLDSPDVVLCDIRDQDAVRQLFLERRPHVVFHAAALKHLPMLEQYPLEAFKTNVVGTANVLAAADAVSVQRFVNISTDKAADPTSVLGYSKRIAERLTADTSRRSAGVFLSVRFGNVLGSRGSVLTTFAAQIAAGGPLTLTHPDVTRYFMTVEEAVQLVTQAAARGCDGEVLILDMGDPVRIRDVALHLIDRSRESIDICYTGLRRGEKMHEQLIACEEIDSRPQHPLISHVAVPPLPPSAVLDAASTVDESSLVSQMRGWCGSVALVCDDTAQAGGGEDRDQAALPTTPAGRA